MREIKLDRAIGVKRASL